MVCQSLLKLYVPGARRQAARSSTVKADCLNPSRGGTHASVGIGTIAQAWWYHWNFPDSDTACIRANSQGERNDVQGTYRRSEDQT